jgi:hypothetical protein
MLPDTGERELVSGDISRISEVGTVHLPASHHQQFSSLKSPQEQQIAVIQKDKVLSDVLTGGGLWCS